MNSFGPMSPFFMEIEIGQCDEFSLVRAASQPEEEVNRLMFEESLTQTQRAVHILNSGSHLQKLHCLSNLNEYLTEENDFASIMPLLHVFFIYFEFVFLEVVYRK